MDIITLMEHISIGQWRDKRIDFVFDLQAGAKYFRKPTLGGYSSPAGSCPVESQEVVQVEKSPLPRQLADSGKPVHGQVNFDDVLIRPS